MQNLYLIGMRGAGKSTVGHLLAKRQGVNFVDMDKKIEQEIGKTISEWVKTQGWAAFRGLERDAVQKFAEQQDVVVATGGGVLMDSDNAQRMKVSGKLILLTAELQTLQARLKNSAERPSLTGGHFLEEIEQVWNERKDRYYHFADQVVSTDGKTPDEIVQEIISEL